MAELKIEIPEELDEKSLEEMLNGEKLKSVVRFSKDGKVRFAPKESAWAQN